MEIDTNISHIISALAMKNNLSLGNIRKINKRCENLFIYYDPDFSFNRGHYNTLYTNLIFYYNKANNFDLYMVNKHVAKPANNIFRGDIISFINRNIAIIKSYNKVIFYSYKIPLGDLSKIMTIRNNFTDYNSINFYINLFIFYYREKLIAKSKNVFNKLATYDNMHLLMDIHYPKIKHIVKKYTLSYPPILNKTSISFANLDTDKHRGKINILVISGENKERYFREYESKLLLKIGAMKNVNLSIKSVNKNRDTRCGKYYLDRLSNAGYNHLLKKTDIIILLYKSKYYKYRTSGIFIETLLNKAILLCSNNLSFSPKVSSFGIGRIFDQNKYESINGELTKIINNMAKYRANYVNNANIENYITQWSIQRFAETTV